MTTAVLIFVAGLFYLASLVSVNFGGASAARKHNAYVAALVGFAFQTAALAFRWWQTQRVPVGTSYELMETIAWLLVALQLAISLSLKIGLVGIFSMLPAAVLTLLPLGCPMFVSVMSDSPKSPQQFAAAHGILAAFSYAFLAAAAVFAALYLKQQKALREKSNSKMAKMLPSLQTLEKGVEALVATSTVSMLASIVVGAFASAGVEVGAVMVFKFAVGAALFSMQAILCAATLAGFVRGARLAKLSIALFVFAILMLVPIELRTVM